MTIHYQVRAHETDTRNDTVFEGSTSSFNDAIDHAERWAAERYGGRETTRSASDGMGKYLVGCMRANGDREPVTSVLTIEGNEVNDKDEDF